MTERRVCLIFGTLYPFYRGGVDVLFTSIFEAVKQEKQWEVVALARRPRKFKRSAFIYSLPTAVLPSLRSGPFGKLFEYVYLSFIDQLYFNKRISSLADNYLKRFDVIITPDPLLIIELYKQKKRPKIIQFVSGAWADTVARSQPLLGSFAERKEREAYKKADKVVFMDETYASHFKVNKERRVLIPNGVNLELFTPSRFERSRLRSHFGMDGKTSIITVAALRKGIKGHEFLLQAIPSVVEMFPNCHFYLVGKGDQESYRNLSQVLGIMNNVHFLGERMDIPELLCASDVFVLPSLSEGTPGALLEAMAMELPCIATRVGNIPEVVRNQQEGILINPANPSEISEAIIHVLSRLDEARMLGVRARRRVQEHYNLTTTAKAYATLIDEVCE
ncbi:MAG: glycosyltransferase family 4 protein [Candidatus Odinarchaeota archaeon]